MYKYDFFDFTAPLEMGQRDSLADMTFEQLSLGATSGLDKAPIVAMQALGSGDDFAGDVSTTGTIEVDGDFITVSNDFVGDVDWFYISVEMDKSYRLVSEDGHIIPSTIYALEDYFGTVAESQNYNQGTGIFYVDNGFFTDYIIAIEHGNDPSQTFRVEELYDDHIGSERTTSEVEVGETLDGQFNFPQDQDWFVLTIDEAGTYRGQLHAQLLPNRFNLQIIDSNGNEISSTGGRTPSTVTRDYTFESAGTYFVIAAAASASNDPFTPYDLTLNQIVNGTEGNDTIVLSNSSAILDAGDGDDVVTASLGNMPSATFTGGDGTDTLNLTVSSYQQIDYRAGSFEVAALRNTDGQLIGRYAQNGTRDDYTQYDAAGTEIWSRDRTIFDSNPDAVWSRREFTYDDNGDLMRDAILLTSGEFTIRVTDSLDTRSFETRSSTYVSEGGPLSSIFVVTDAGFINSYTYDYADENLSWDIYNVSEDTADLVGWSQIENYHLVVDGARILTRRVIERDDSFTSDENFVAFGADAGASVRILSDTFDTQSWDSWTFNFNSDRDVTDYVRSFDDGILQTVAYDRDGTYDWARRSFSEDLDDVFNWESIDRIYDDEGQTISVEYLYDEGFTRFSEYDLNGEYNWARKITRTEVDGAVTEYYYDDNGELYDTISI